MYVSVSDSRGLPITGLDRSAFTLTEDGAAQTLDRFAVSSDSQVPIAFGLVMDVSGSMNDAGKLDAAKQAAKQVVMSLGPQDEAAVISFGDTAQVVQAITSDQGALSAAIDGLQASGNTALYDAIQKTTLLAEALPQPLKVQLIVTDGTDTKSATRLNDVLQNLRTSGSVVYVVGIGSDVDRRVLDQIAQAGNGDALYTDDPSVLSGSFQNILNQLRLTYLLHYHAPSASSDQQHTLATSVSYQGQVAQADTTFTAAPSAVAVDVSGVTPGETLPADDDRDVQATLHAGNAERIDILVDGAAVASSTGQPTSLETELDGLPAGDHDLAVRVADSAGGVSEQHVPFSIAAEATPAPVATSVPSEAATPATASQPGAFVSQDWWWLPVFLLVVLALAAVGRWLAWLTRSTSGSAGAGAASDADDTTLELEAPLERTPVASGVSETPRVSIESNGQRQDVALGGQPLSIGRDADNSIVLRDLHVSRHHARITLENGEYWIEDLASQNGTLLDGQMAIDRRKLEPGDQFAIGAATLTYLGQMAGPTHGAAPPPQPPTTAAATITDGGRLSDDVRPTAVSGISP